MFMKCSKILLIILPNKALITSFPNENRLLALEVADWPNFLVAPPNELSQTSLDEHVDMEGVETLHW